MKTDKNSNSAKKKKEADYPGYPASPKGEDIYDNAEEADHGPGEDDREMDMGLDVPGSNQDNHLEDIGEEDEENNYYSLPDQDDE